MALDSSLLARLYDRAHAARWELTRERFAEAVEASVACALGSARASAQEIEQYLALAAACAAGHESAWDQFVLEHRPVLYRAADALDPSGGARELADSLYAELYGLKEQKGERQSLFRYFHGRSRLTTWLRAVLAQRRIDTLRAGRRLDPLPDDPEQIGAPIADEPAADRARWMTAMRDALGAAIATLEARDRLRLSCYYAQNLTLAEIGRLLREHEATVSRHLARTRRTLRESVEQTLRTREGLNEAAIRECFASVVENAGTLDLAEVLAGSKVGGVDRSE
jgi:RNA polymerase sigma factor (sigma-70 family)